MADNYQVRVMDMEGTSFRMGLSFAIKGFDAIWQTTDKGFIRYNSGQTSYTSSTGTFTGYHLHFNYNDDWGIRFNDWFDILGINSEGSGWLYQSWVIAIKPGRISWYII